MLRGEDKQGVNWVWGRSNQRRRHQQGGADHEGESCAGKPAANHFRMASVYSCSTWASTS